MIRTCHLDQIFSRWSHQKLYVDFIWSQEVYVLTSGVHALATQILAPSTRKILQAEGVRNLTPLAFYEWCHEKRGFGKVHIFKDIG